MSTKGDEIGLVEAAYTLVGDTSQWLAGITAAASFLDDGLGISAYRLYDGIRSIDAFASSNPDVVTREVVIAASESVAPEYRDAIFPTHAVTTLSERLGGSVRNHPIYDAWFLPAGIEDALGVVAADGTDALIVLSAPLRRLTRLKPRERARLDRIAIHIATANRLRERCRDRDVSRMDAVLTPDGQVLDARGAAREPIVREALRERARAIDRARTAAVRADGLAALELWEGLVRGQWSLCDHFDSDGRRFIVVRENDPNCRPQAGLSRRETQVLLLYGRGQSQKLIAYELGLSTTSVSQTLSHVAARLGARSLADLASIGAKLVALLDASRGAGRT